MSVEPWYKYRKGYINNDSINKDRLQKLRVLHNASCTFLNEMLDEGTFTYNQMAYDNKVCHSVSYTALNNICYMLKCDMAYLTDKTSTHIDTDNIITKYINPDSCPYKASDYMGKYIKICVDMSHRCKIPVHVMKDIFSGKVHVSINVKNNISKQFKKLQPNIDVYSLFVMVYDKNQYTYTDSIDLKDKLRLETIELKLQKLQDKQRDLALKSIESMLKMLEVE